MFCDAPAVATAEVLVVLVEVVTVPTDVLVVVGAKTGGEVTFDVVAGGGGGGSGTDGLPDELPMVMLTDSCWLAGEV